MEETLKLIVETLVINKENVSIKKEENDETIKFKVSIPKEEMGRVIGRKGKIAQAIRTVIKSIAAKEKKMAEIEFTDF